MPEELDNKEDIEKVLLAYEEKTFGFKPIRERDLPKVLSMTVADLKRESSYVISTYMLDIANYLIDFNRLLNHEKGWRSWAKSNIKMETSKSIKEINGNYGYNQKELVAGYSTTKLQKLQAFLRVVDVKISRIESTEKDIRYFCDMLNNFRIAKMSVEKNLI